MKLTKPEASGSIAIRAMAGEAPMILFNQTFRGMVDGGRRLVHPPLAPLAGAHMKGDLGRLMQIQDDVE